MYDQHRKLIAYEPPRVPRRASSSPSIITSRSSVFQQRVHEKVEQIAFWLVWIEPELHTLKATMRLRSQKPVSSKQPKDIVDASLVVCERVPHYVISHALLASALHLSLLLLRRSQFLVLRIRIALFSSKVLIQLRLFVILVIRVASKIDHVCT